MKIFIIGGGITGLTTGLALDKYGVDDYQIFERAAELNEVGAGIMLQPNAMRVLDWLGIGDKIRKAGQPIDRAEITDQNLVPLRQASQLAGLPYSKRLMTAIHRARLQKILINALPRDKVKLNHTLIDCQQEERSCQAIFTSGSAYSEIILAADGINSIVRQKLFPSSRARYAGQTCWRGIAMIPMAKRERPIAQEAWGPNLRFGFVRISKQEMYWYAVSNAHPGGQDSGAIKAYLLQKFENFHSDIGKIIGQTDVDRIIRNDIYDLKRLAKWSKNQICLIGDAAHATTPNLGQGACQGIEDAYYLSRALDKYQDAPIEAFRKFESDRRKKVDQVVKTSWRLGKMAHQPQLRFVAKTLMRYVPERLMVKQMNELFSVQGLD